MKEHIADKKLAPQVHGIATKVADLTEFYTNLGAENDLSADKGYLLKLAQE